MPTTTVHRLPRQPALLLLCPNCSSDVAPPPSGWTAVRCRCGCVVQPPGEDLAAVRRACQAVVKRLGLGRSRADHNGTVSTRRQEMAVRLVMTIGRDQVVQRHLGGDVARLQAQDATGERPRLRYSDAAALQAWHYDRAGRSMGHGRGVDALACAIVCELEGLRHAAL